MSILSLNVLARPCDFWCGRLSTSVLMRDVAVTIRHHHDKAYYMAEWSYYQVRVPLLQPALTISSCSVGSTLWPPTSRQVASSGISWISFSGSMRTILKPTMA